MSRIAPALLAAVAIVSLACNETVVETVPVEEVVITPSRSEVAIGSTAEFDVTLRGQGGVLTGRTVDWELSDPTVAELVVANGDSARVEADTVGQTEVIATAEGVSERATIDVGPGRFYSVDAGSDSYYSLDWRTGDTVFIRRLDPNPNDTTERFTTPVALAKNSSQDVFVWTNTDPQSTLIEVDLCTGQTTIVDSLVNGGDALAFGPEASAPLYALGYSDLNEIDPSDGSTVREVQLSRRIDAAGLAATESGDLLAGNTTTPSGADTLYRVEPETGNVDVIGVLNENIGTLGTLAFDGTGTLWGTGFNGPDGAIVFTIDTATAAVANVQPSEEAPQGMAFAEACR